MLIKEKKRVQYISIDEASDGQRVDNFLIKILKKVHKSHIYKILRSGEVRVNKKRVKSDFKLTLDDEVRVPPLAMDESRRSDTPVAKHNIQDSIIFEDDVLIALNKPAGIAVHGGSGIHHGVIELLRHERPNDSFLELVHRIDKETSGILLIAKKRSALLHLHKQIRDKKIHKKYLAVVFGKWQKKQLNMDLDLSIKNDGDRGKKVKVVSSKNANIKSKESRSVFFLRQVINDVSFLDIKLITGRMHQIRVHLSFLGFPIVGDDKYGNFDLNKDFIKKGMKRMCLHAIELGFQHPLTNQAQLIKAPEPKEFSFFKNNA